MRLAVIGNSHLAMLKLAWDRIATGYPDVKAWFFGAPGNALRSCEARGGLLEPPGEAIARSFFVTSGGRKVISLQEYDVLVYYGLFLDVPRLEVRLSTAVRDAAIDGAVDAAASVQLAARVRAISGISQVILPNPLFAAMPMFIDPFQRMLPYPTILRAVERRILTKVDGVSVIGQPEALIRHDLLTDRIWNIGSTRLATTETMTGTEGRGGRDFKHMNVDFGEQVWADLLPRLRNILPSPPLAGVSPNSLAP